VRSWRGAAASLTPPSHSLRPTPTARTQTIKNLARALDIDPVKLTIPSEASTSFEIGGEMGDEDLHPLVVLKLPDGRRVVGV
jgi:hypothetical protein